MSSEKELNQIFRKPCWLIELVSAVQPFPKSSEATGMSPLLVSKKLLSFSAVKSSSFLSPELSPAMMLSLFVEQMPLMANSSTGERSSPRSTKPTKSATVKPGDAERWIVKPHREVGKDITDYGLSDPDFSPTLARIFDALERDPKQFGKKKGKGRGSSASFPWTHTTKPMKRQAVASNAGSPNESPVDFLIACWCDGLFRDLACFYEFERSNHVVEVGNL